MNFCTLHLIDHVLFWNGRDLQRKLREFQSYYNAARCHASLHGHTPLTFAGGRRMVSRRSERGALGLPLPGPCPAPNSGLMTNSRRTGPPPSWPVFSLPRVPFLFSISRRFLIDARLLDREPGLPGVIAASRTRDAAWVALRRHHHLFDLRLGFQRRA